MSILNNSIITVVTKIVQALLIIVSAIFLARLIEPHDFGTYSIVMATYGLFTGFLDVGLSASFIKVDKVSQGLRNSFFTINIFLGLVTTFLLIISAPIISKVYGDTQLLSLMITFSLTVFISSLGIQGLAELNRAKSFSKIMIINILTTLGTVVVSIGFAYLGFGVWTFIIAAFSRTTLQTGLVFLL